jgi:hypothetical protein
MQLDDWVLCRIYEKSTHAQRAGKEHENSSVEEVLASLPEIDDPRLMLPRLNSVGGTESAQALVDSMTTTSENGASIDMMPNHHHHHHHHPMQENLQTASTLTNEWKLQQSHGALRYNMELASSAQRHQTLMRPNMVDMAGSQFHRSSYKAMPMPAAGRSASDEEVQSTFRFSSAEGSLESMFPSAHMQGYEHQLSYARPSSGFNFSYGPPGHHDFT